MTSPDCVSVPLCCGWWREQWQCMTGGLWWHSLLYSPHSLLSPHSAILNSVLRWSAGAMPECQWVRARPAGPAVGPVQGFSSISEFDWVQAARPHSGGHSHTLSLSLGRAGDRETEVWLRYDDDRTPGQCMQPACDGRGAQLRVNNNYSLKQVDSTANKIPFSRLFRKWHKLTSSGKTENVLQSRRTK